MTKRIVALLMAVLMCLSLFGCNDSSDKATDKKDSGATVDQASTSSSTPLLYKVTDDSGNVIWLFGSIHVGRDDFYPLPDYVLDAYESSDAIAFEFNIDEFESDMKAQMDALTPLVYNDGTTIKDYIPEDTYDKAVEIMEENNVYSVALDFYVPSFWSTSIDNCTYIKLEYDVNSGIDRHFLELAQEDKKEILEVESAALQYQILADFSEQLQIYLLESSIEAYNDLENSKKDVNKLMDLWANGDEEELADYLDEEEELQADEVELYEEYNNALIVERNNSMTEYAQELLKTGKEVFICVGAAHIVGEGAMAQQLKELGYTVEIVR